ncbi:hypothetical protein [Yersinia enterocolitica]|uniref:hypothetical protein n=1 Tax=Yersinia enterocolitica TaxID=630 RepID=UPI003F41BF1D
MDMQILQQINHWAACARLTSECSSVVHADLLEKAADHITSIESQLETARKRITELENAALVPGVLHCAKCNFQLSKTNLYMKSGTTGPGDNKTEPCPNGCGPLWPVTWRLWAFDASATADKYFDELKAAEARLSAANEKLKGEQVPVTWTDAEELRGMAKDGCGYLFKVDPANPFTDPRRQIMLFTAPQKPVVLPERYSFEVCATPDPNGEWVAVDEIIEAIKAAGGKVEGE